jgi:hypothetical protein
MTPIDLEHLLDAGAAASRLAVPAATRPEVLRYLALAAGMAEVVLAHPVAARDETGAVFAPVEPAAPR